jgi:predicted nucleotidyltransferase
MTLTSGLDIPTERLAEICRRYHVTEMSVFGSAVHGGMREDSDVDVMVVLDPEAKLGWEFFGIADELSELFVLTSFE